MDIAKRRSINKKILIISGILFGLLFLIIAFSDGPKAPVLTQALTPPFITQH